MPDIENTPFKNSDCENKTNPLRSIKDLTQNARGYIISYTKYEIFPLCVLVIWLLDQF